MPEPLEADWRIDRAGGTATLLTPATALGTYIVPLAPMLGCFGVAPPGGQAISTATAAEHGGNMDYRGFAAGVTVYLPVFVPGALLHLGDGHAVQGDGEIAGTGIEVRALLQVVLPRPTLTPQRALALLHYTQRQNHNAHRSHRKRVLRRLLDSS